MKAVIPAAGLGTRFLPYTKSQPKEMLPIVDTPAIQYVVEEAVAAGLKDILIVTGKTKRAIEDHFDRSPDLEAYLSGRGQRRELRAVRRIDNLANIMYVRQKEPRGLGDAVLSAERYVGDETFAVLLGDDVCMSTSPCIGQLAAFHRKLEAAVLALQPVPRNRLRNYGVVSAQMEASGALRVTSIVEKPKPRQITSNLATIGRYVLPASIFRHLRGVRPDQRGEIQLTSAIGSLLRNEPVYGLIFRGRRYDIGDRDDWLRANLEVRRWSGRRPGPFGRA